VSLRNTALVLAIIAGCTIVGPPDLAKAELVPGGWLEAPSRCLL
jgi:hypothetical protein